MLQHVKKGREKQESWKAIHELINCFNKYSNTQEIVILHNTVYRKSFPYFPLSYLFPGIFSHFLSLSSGHFLPPKRSFELLRSSEGSSCFHTLKYHPLKLLHLPPAKAISQKIESFPKEKPSWKNHRFQITHFQISFCCSAAKSCPVLCDSIAGQAPLSSTILHSPIKSISQDKRDKCLPHLGLEDYLATQRERIQFCEFATHLKSKHIL